jgi:LacI family transcriptional regulator
MPTIKDVAPGDFRVQGGEAALESLLAATPPPWAVFACNDLMASGVLRAARRAGLRVPGDLSVVGFDDIPLASAVSPALTTVAQPIADLAKASVQLLLACMQTGPRGQPTQRIVLDPHLTVRDSCAPAEGGDRQAKREQKGLSSQRLAPALNRSPL